MLNRCNFLLLIALAISACAESDKTKAEMGTYGYDQAFFARHGIATEELSTPDGMSRILIVPAYQARVMTSTTGGLQGRSYGWINYKYIEKGEVSPQFNPFGGEERFWLGPEGGPFSWFFKPGEEQDYAHWKVPAVMDTEPFEKVRKEEASILFSKQFELTNASGHVFRIGVERRIALLDKKETGALFGAEIPESVKSLCYLTENTLINRGDASWTRETGMPSVWLLCTFNPTPTTTVFAPYDMTWSGTVVNDSYFGKVPSDRLVADGGVIYFKIDGEYRAKIGLPPGSSLGFCGSYDAEAGVLNLLKYNKPKGNPAYVNGQWGPQDDPFSGDAVNAYNDGPTETGTVMGPFFEIETSSPAAALAPGEKLIHIQHMLHLEGSHEDLSRIARAACGVDLNQVAAQFK